MSKRLWRLMLSQINVGFGLSQAKYYYLRKRERLWEGVLIPFSLLSLAASLGFGVFKFASAYYAAYARFGQGDVTLLLGVLICQLVTLVLGFAMVVGNFYYANDLSVLIPLPFRPWEVLAGKLALLLAGEYAVQAVFFLPTLLAYGIGARVAPIPYSLAALIVFLALPVIPLTLAAIPAVLLIRVLGGAKRRDTLLVAAGFLFIVLIVVGQFYFQSRLLGPGGQTNEFLQRLLGTAHGLADWLGRLYPPAA